MSARDKVLREFGTAVCVKNEACSHFDCQAERQMADEILTLRARVAALRAMLVRVVGSHHAPNDCYATGPSTGDAFGDLVSCPSCEAIAMLAARAAGGSDAE